MARIRTISTRASRALPVASQRTPYPDTRSGYGQTRTDSIGWDPQRQPKAYPPDVKAFIGKVDKNG